MRWPCRPPRRGARAVRATAGAPHPLGLLSEDIDPSTGEWWGNYPQTYSLVGLINCADPPEPSWRTRDEPAGCRLQPRHRCRSAPPRPVAWRSALRPRMQSARRHLVRLVGRGDRRAPRAASITNGGASPPRRSISKPDYRRILQRLRQPHAVAAVPLLGSISPQYSRSDLGRAMRVNERFAETLLPLIEPDDLVWVQDYHLIPLGRELRERGVKNRIGFFLHIPWPRANCTPLPCHRRLVRIAAPLRRRRLPHRASGRTPSAPCDSTMPAA